MRLQPLKLRVPFSPVPNRNVELFGPGSCYEPLGMCVANQEIAMSGPADAVYRSECKSRLASDTCGRGKRALK
jgi:hypothetical protein